MDHPRNMLEEQIKKNFGEVVDGEMSFDIPKIEKPVVNYRQMEHLTVRCEICQFYNPAFLCKIIKGEIFPNWVCDAYQGSYEVDQTYDVESFEKFVEGLVRSQPMQTKILGGLRTPAGKLLLIEDSMKPNPHRYSMWLEGFISNTSLLNGWTQEEVDNL